MLYGSVKSAAHMHGGVVLFLDGVEKVNTVLVSGIVVRDTLVPAMPLVMSPWPTCLHSLRRRLWLRNL